MKKISITVGIPMYNDEHRIVRAIASVLNQSWKGESEILIVDDCSTDNSFKTVNKISERYTNIRLLSHAENRGRPAARNTLIDNARYEYFAMLDSDDEWYLDKLQRQVDLLDSIPSTTRDKAIICGNIHHIDLDTGSERTKNFSKGYGENYGLKNLLESDNTPISQLALIKTETMRQIGYFDKSLTRAQDWDYLIRLFEFGCKMYFVHGKPLANFYFTKKNRSFIEIEKCMHLVIEKHSRLYHKLSVNPIEVKRKISNYINSFK
jgi:glycosyltransferase involved in cell wall biosynthesis